MTVESDYLPRYVPPGRPRTWDNLSSQRLTAWIVILLLLAITALSVFDLYLLMSGLS